MEKGKDNILQAFIDNDRGNRCKALVDVNTLDEIGSECTTLKINSTLSISDRHILKQAELSTCSPQALSFSIFFSLYFVAIVTTISHNSSTERRICIYLFLLKRDSYFIQRDQKKIYRDHLWIY